MIIKSVSFNSIENISKVIVWSSNHMNFVNNNIIEMNFENLSFKVLYLSVTIQLY